MPEWAKGAENPYDTAQNPTVNVLFRVHLDQLAAGNYEQAFDYVTHLTNPYYGEDRDVVFFPKRMMVHGELCYIMLHRPVNPSRFPCFTETRPSVVIAVAKEFSDFALDRCVERKLLLYPTQDWQTERVGIATPPVDLGEGKWLVNYFGKKDAEVGYAQSFLKMEERENELPRITAICKEKLIWPSADFEQPRRFSIPVVFFTGLIEHDNDLLVCYGAADEVVGLMRVDRRKVLELLEE
jgi:predicted GH43/DUF377 family glycosyl hydrolase